MTECRCPQGDSGPCLARAKAEAETSDNPLAMDVVELIERTRIAEGFTYHITDPVVLDKVATLMADGLERAERLARMTPEERQRIELRRAEADASREVRALARERARHT